jgi:site-specific DNA-adenine methylase
MMPDLIQNSRLQEIESELEELATIATRLFRRAGGLLAEIRDKKLYRDGRYPTFEAYVQQRWHITRGRAYHLVNAALAVSELAEHFEQEQLPQNESVARPLVPLEPLERVEVWSKAPVNPQRKDVAALVEDYKIVGVYPLIGSKWKMSKVIAERARGIEFEKYLEPFVGSGAVFFRLVDEGLIKKPAVLNDLNQLAIALFRTIRDHPDELQQRLALVPYARVERSQSEPAADADELEKAVWWGIHTFQGYVGHKSKNKGWSVDHSSHAGRHEKWNRFKEQIPAMGKVLCERAAFECMDGLEFIKKYTGKSDRNLLYVDPPYFGFEETYHACFARHQELAELLVEVPAAGVFVTYYDCDQLRQLYPESHWSWELFERWSTCTADGVRQRRDEVLLTRKERVSVAIAAPQVQIAPSPTPAVTQSQSTSQVKSGVESSTARIQAEAARLRAEYQPGEIQQLISLLKLD